MRTSCRCWDNDPARAATVKGKKIQAQKLRPDSAVLLWCSTSGAYESVRQHVFIVRTDYLVGSAAGASPSGGLETVNERLGACSAFS